jgi:HK97 family phage major capsid protein
VSVLYQQSSPSRRGSDARSKLFLKEETMNMFATYQREADEITRKPMNAQSRARLSFLLNAMATLREFGQDKEVRTSTNDASNFRKKFLAPEARTYTPMSDSVEGASLIASDFEVRLKNLMLADGPLFAGSSLLTNIFVKVMQPGKITVSDDLSSPGVIVSENTTTNEEELTGLSSITIGNNSSNFSTGILLASTSLAEDVAPETFEDIVQKTAAPRLSRIQNSTFFAALKTALAANSSAAVSAAGGSIAKGDPETLVASVGAAYRVNGAFLMSPATQKAISLIVDANSRPVYRQILEAQPTLLNYPVFTVASASTNDVQFGDYSFMFCKSTPVQLRVLRERFRLDGYYGYILNERAEAKWTVASTSDSPVKYLTFA